VEGALNIALGQMDLSLATLYEHIFQINDARNQISGYAAQQRQTQFQEEPTMFLEHDPALFRSICVAGLVVPVSVIFS